MLQEVHPVDTAIHPSGRISLSPERDLVAMLPFWVRKAREIMRMNEEDPAGADDLMKVIQKFFLSCADSQEFVSRKVGDAAVRAGLTKEDVNAAEARLGKWLLRVLLGAYYYGLRGSTLQGQAPVRFIDVTKPLPPAMP